MDGRSTHSGPTVRTRSRSKLTTRFGTAAAAATVVTESSTVPAPRNLLNTRPFSHRSRQTSTRHPTIASAMSNSAGCKEDLVSKIRRCVWAQATMAMHLASLRSKGTLSAIPHARCCSSAQRQTQYRDAGTRFLLRCDYGMPVHINRALL